MSTNQMQRRHYEYIAYVLSKAPNYMKKQEIVELFVQRLMHTNLRFDANRFRDACECKPEQSRDTRRASPVVTNDE